MGHQGAAGHAVAAGGQGLRDLRDDSGVQCIQREQVERAGHTYTPNRIQEMRPTVEMLSLDGDGSFRADRGLYTIKTVSDIKTFLGRPSGRPHYICSRLGVARSSLAPP